MGELGARSASTALTTAGGAAKLYLLIVAAVALGGCQQQPGGREQPNGETNPPMPTPFPEVATTPAFQQWAIDRTLEYREQAPNALPVGFGLEIRTYEQALSRTADGLYQLLISSVEPPSDWFVTPLGWEGIVLAVHPQNRVRELDLEQLRSLFNGQVANWEQLGGSSLAIEPVIPLKGDEMREHLAATLMDGRPFTQAALLGPTPELAIDLIAETPGAIGMLPLSAVSNSVRSLIIEGVAARSSTVADGSYPFRVELLAAAPVEPDGQVRDWLVWLQAGG